MAEQDKKNSNPEAGELISPEEKIEMGKIDTQKLDRNHLKDLSDELIKENESLREELEKAQDELEKQREKYRRAEKIVAQATEMSNSFQRLQVDFDNYRKRNVEIESKAKEDAEVMIGLKMVPIYDNFLRAISATSEPDTGTLMIAKQFEQALIDLHFERIQAKGQPFDAGIHDAVMTMKAESEAADELVVEIVTEGYTYKNRVVKHPQVIVAKWQE